MIGSELAGLLWRGFELSWIGQFVGVDELLMLEPTAGRTCGSKRNPELFAGRIIAEADALGINGTVAPVKRIGFTPVDSGPFQVD